MDSLILSTCQAPNMDFICRDLAAYLSARLSLSIQVMIDIPWQERERLLDAGEIDLCWICGLPYVWKAGRAPRRIEPLVAPVMAGERYQSRPLYYSDVVVHRDSPFLKFADLRGASWAYNEPGSQSGYGVVRYALATRGETFKYFGRMSESGAHQASLQMILRREVDASAIDSTVLEQELLDHPESASQIRIIDTFGPSPIPPWVVAARIPLEIRQALRHWWVNMETDPEGQALLKKSRLARFSPVEDHDYDPIRAMERFSASLKSAG